jgi:hypothetical protein
MNRKQHRFFDIDTNMLFDEALFLPEMGYCALIPGV